MPPAWTLEAHLLDEVRRSLAALGGVKNPKPAPGRFTRQGPPDTPEYRKARAATARRIRERKRRIEAGEIT